MLPERELEHSERTMRRFILSAAVGAALAGVGSSQVVADWVLLGQPGNQVSTAASNAAANVSGLDLTRGAGINPSSAVDSFSGTGWNTLDATDYFSFGVTVASGWSLSPSELWVGTRASNTGPGNVGLFHSGDNFQQSLFTFVQSGTATTYTVVDLSVLGSVSGTLEFRLMALDNTAAGGGTVGSTGAFRLAEYSVAGTDSPVRLTGSVQPVGGLGTPDCFGDGSGNPCPCNNLGATGQGCANASGQGATLEATGSSSITAGNLVLTGSNLMPGQAGLFFQGDQELNNGVGLVFGDGLRCAGGQVVRLQVANADAGGVAQSNANIASLGGVAPGETKSYQLWYQDAGPSPCGFGFNLTHSVTLTWAP